MKRPTSTSFAFTIVELLVVIVVIGVLAAITVVSYTGVTNRAVASSLKADLTSASRQLDLFQVEYNYYPSTVDCTIPDSATNKCLGSNQSIFHQYISNNNTNPKGFCLAYKKGEIIFNKTENKAVEVGDCSSYGLVLSLDAGNSSSYPGSGTAWSDLSGLGGNGTLVNGVAYSAMGNGSLSFDGVNDYVGLNAAPVLGKSGSLFAWVNVTSWKTSYDSIIFKGPGVSWPDIDYGIFRDLTTNQFLGTLNDGSHNLSRLGPKSSPISLGTWYQLVFTWADGVLKFYTNDQETGSASFAYGPGARSNNMKIGSHVLGNGYFFNGNISIIQIFNRALSSDEVVNKFNNLKIRYGYS